MSLEGYISGFIKWLHFSPGNECKWTNVIRLPEIKTAQLSTYGNFAKCRQAHFRVPRVGLGTRLQWRNQTYVPTNCSLRDISTKVGTYTE